jgi:hypothetical protein
MTLMARPTFPILAGFLLASLSSYAQTIDARGPNREALTRVETGHGGSIGRKLQVSISVEVPPSAANSDGNYDILFLLTNIGDTDLVLPVSPHPRDFEVGDPPNSYSVRHLSLYLTTDKQPESALWGAHLYGNPTVHGSLTTLRPTATLRVLAKLTKPSASRGHSVTAHAVLNEEMIKSRNGDVSADSEEIGSAHSRTFDLNALMPTN